MIIESQKNKEEFDNKYWVCGHMLESLSEYSLNHDTEMLVERCNLMLSLYLYVDDISEEKMLEIFNGNKSFNHRDFIPHVSQKIFDDIDLDSENTTLFSKMGEKYKAPSLVKIIDWK